MDSISVGQIGEFSPYPVCWPTFKVLSGLRPRGTFTRFCDATHDQKVSVCGQTLRKIRSLFSGKDNGLRNKRLIEGEASFQAGQLGLN